MSAQSSWWSTPGAAILLTGLIAIGAGVIPVLLKPWVDSKLRRARRIEETKEGWLESARQLSVELEGLLELYGIGSLLTDRSATTVVPWESGGIRTKSALVLTFGPSAQLQKSGVNLFEAIDLLHARAVTMLRMQQKNPQSPTVDKAQQDVERFRGEAVLALRQFVESIGGPPAPPRDAFTLPLKTDPKE